MLNSSTPWPGAALALCTLVILAGCTNPAAVTRSAANSTAAADTAAVRAILVPGSGSYSRPISTKSAAAQQFFDQGLRFAWGFYFPESIASYQQASLLDPAHPMPYWGLAHAMGPNPNSRYARMPDDPKGNGLAAINQALARIDRASPLERDLINALATFYDQSAIPDAAARDQAYLARMRELNQRHPDHSDIAALYAGAYMSIRRWDYWDAEGNPKDETAAVAQALEHIMRTDMSNPGVLHLYIHLLEASLEPERALAAADALEATVPIAGHVVHMPAHIYVRVGQYQRAIDNNVRSQQVDNQLAAIWGDRPLPNLGTYPLSHRLHAGHAKDFIRYAATVQGNYRVAIEAAESAKTHVLNHGNDIGRAQKSIAAPWLVNKIFGQWDQLIGQQPSHSGMPYLDGIWAYALGGAAVATGDMALAAQQLEALQAIANAPDADSYRVGATPASDVLRLAALGLTGEMREAQGDLEGAIAAYRQGVALEDLNNYTEPPDWAQPMRHYLGAALLAAGRPSEAEAVYRRDLRWNQGNGWSLFGLAQALAEQGKAEQAAAAHKRWQDAWVYADVTLARSHR